MEDEQKVRKHSLFQRAAITASLAILNKAKLRAELKAAGKKGKTPMFPRMTLGTLWNASGNWGTIENALWGRGYTMFPGTNIDYVAEVGDLQSSSLTMAVWQYIGTALTEAPPMVKAYGKGDTVGEPIPDHPLVQLFKNPNPYYDGVCLMQSLALDWLFSGDVYWIKVREGKYLTPVQLWYAPCFMVRPVSDPNDPSVFIKNYIYTVDGVEYPYPVEDIFHLQRGINRHDIRRGIGVFDSVLREIYTDNVASNFSAAVLKNWGVVPYVISPQRGTRADQLANQFGDDPETAKARALEIKQDFINSTTGDQAGKPVVNTIPLDIKKLGFSPYELDIGNLRKVPESRVASVSGCPASLLQYLVGLEHGTSYASYKEAREQAFESVIVPLLRIIASAINKQLMPDFGDPKARRLEFSFDLAGIRVLQDDEDKLYSRVSQAVQQGWLLVSDARAAVGLPFTENDKIYLRTNQQVIKYGEDPAPPPPPPPTLPTAPAPKELTAKQPDAEEPDAIDGEVIDVQKPKPKQLTAGKSLDLRAQFIKFLVSQNGHNGNGFKYSPDQPRDDHGRWTDSGGAAGTFQDSRLSTVVDSVVSFLRKPELPVSKPTALDKRLIDYKPDRSLSDPEKVQPIVEMLNTPWHNNAGHNARLEYYSQLPFIDKLHKEMGVTDPATISIEEYSQRRKDFFNKLPVTEVPLDHIVVTQQFVNRDRVHEIMDHPETGGESTPFLVRFAGETYVINGHHRIAADVLKFKPSIRGRVWNLGWDFEKHVIVDETKYAVENWDRTVEIRAYLRMISELTGAPAAGYKYNGLDQLVLREGHSFTAAPLPEGIERGKVGLAYLNAYKAVTSHPDLDLEYVEGVAQTSAMSTPVRHAWAVTKEGKVVDPTWDHFLKEGQTIAYYGVKIPLSVVQKTIFARGKYGVLDDFEHKYPLLRTGVQFLPRN